VGAEDRQVPRIIIGPDELCEPFACWTDSAISVAKIDGLLYALPPVNDDAADLFVWSGPDVAELNPVRPMRGIQKGVHTHRGHVFDGDWWPLALWVAPDGTWQSFMHAEDWHQIDTGKAGFGGNDLRTIALWTSADQGGNWEYQGPVITIADEFALPGGKQTTWPRNGGAGDHKLVLDPSGSYMHLLYTNFTYDPPRRGVDLAHGNLAVARATVSSRGLPGTWHKYYKGEFAEPGVGGRESWVMSSYDGESDNSQRSAIWSTYLDCYVMVFTVRTSYCRISYSIDLVNWTPSEYLYRDDAAGINYASLIDAAPGGTDQLAGRSVWLYYTRSDYEVHRRLLTFDTQRDPAVGLNVTASTEVVNDGFEPSAVPVPAAPARSYQSSSGFSGTQGSDRWSYMYLARLSLRKTENWSPLYFDEESGSWLSERTESRIGRGWQASAPGMDTARVWRSPGPGVIRISGEATAQGTSDHGYIRIKIMKNREKLWPKSRGWRALGAGVALNPAALVAVSAGDRIFFIMRTSGPVPSTVTWDPLVEFSPIIGRSFHGIVSPSLV
jgi:hypothetical protein